MYVFIYLQLEWEKRKNKDYIGEDPFISYLINVNVLPGKFKKYPYNFAILINLYVNMLIYLLDTSS